MNAADLQAVTAWAESFVCPDPSGYDAPCTLTDTDVAPTVPGPAGRRYRCPVYQRIQCEPWQRHEERREERRREREAAQQRRDHLERAAARGVPLRFVDATLDFPSSAAAAVRDFLAGDAMRGRALVLIAPCGVGKTAAAAAAVMAWPRRAYLLEADALARAAAHDHDELGELVDTAEEVSLLAIDDLGRSRWKTDGLAADVLEQILCRRHAALMPTLVTSNWKPAELRRRLSARVLDRLTEWATIVALPGTSLRTAEA